jgi:hypothetical protein
MHIKSVIIVGFHNDIFFTGEVRALASEFFCELKVRIASAVDVDMVEVSMSNVDMHAVNVFKDGLRRLGTRPRPRVQGPPLSGESAHPRWVHLHWPRATIKMKQRWSTRADLVNRFHAYGLTANLPLEKTSTLVRHARDLNGKDITWLPMGLHPVLQQANIGAALDKFMIDQQWREVYRYAFQCIEPPEH